MAKKSGSSSTRSDLLSFSRVLAFIVLVLAVVILIVLSILRLTDNKSWGGIGILSLIKDLALIGAIAIPAFYFVKPKKQAWRIIYWICLVIIIVAAVFGNLNII